MKRTKKIIISLIIITILSLIIAEILINKNEKLSNIRPQNLQEEKGINTNIENNVNLEENKINDLSEDELNDFTKLFNENLKYNGIVQCEFSNPDEINLEFCIRDCLGKNTNISKEEIQGYSKEHPIVPVEDIGLYKYDTKSIQNFYKEMFGKDIQIDELKKKLSDYYYNENYDSFYKPHTDSTFHKVKCVSGNKKDDGTYEIVLQDGEDEDDWYVVKNEKESDEELLEEANQMKLTLRKDKDSYIFISNEKQ